jgi:hypothetical protein
VNSDDGTVTPSGLEVYEHLLEVYEHLLEVYEHLLEVDERLLEVDEHLKAAPPFNGSGSESQGGASLDD